MKVLFVSSGNSGDIGVVVKKQAESLINQSIDIDFYLIKGKGISGYLKNIKAIRKIYKTNHYNIIHAHYSLSAFAATLTGAKPLVVSLMGSDGQKSGWQKWLIKKYSAKRWKTTIAKSPDLVKKTGIKQFKIIPNGVDLDSFYPASKQEAKQKLGLETNIRYLFFAANPKRYEKNFVLAQTAFESLNLKNSELLSMTDIPHNEVFLWMNAADVILLTSLWEGSPNVIKEAMACNCPVVATDVGDIKLMFGNEPGHFLTDFNPENVAKKIQKALEFSEKHSKTNGRKRIVELGLDSETIAGRIVNIYKEVIKK